MGHSDAQMILEIYSKLTKEQEANDAIKLANFMSGDGNAQKPEKLEISTKIGRLPSKKFEPFLNLVLDL